MANEKDLNLLKKVQGSPTTYIKRPDGTGHSVTPLERAALLGQTARVILQRPELLKPGTDAADVVSALEKKLQGGKSIPLPLRP